MPPDGVPVRLPVRLRLADVNVRQAGHRGRVINRERLT
jgi:hypothetical protein